MRTTPHSVGPRPSRGGPFSKGPTSFISAGSKSGELMKTGTQRFRKTVVTRAILTALCGTATMMVAQETLAQQSGSSLQRVEVTGSNIRRTDTETASPVQVITAQEIEQSGKGTVAEYLQTLTADSQGSVP